MTDLHHSVPIAAAPPAIYAAIATQAGMQGWWTKDTVMNATQGGAADFGFDK